MANFFFASAGNDSLNTGKSSASPYKTLIKLNSLALVSGDVVSFLSGDLLPGTFNPVSGVTYTSYGTGNRPVISGFETLTGWTNFGSGVYYATNVNLGATVKLVTLNNALQPIGRFPKTGYRTYTANNANLSITDASLTTSYVGAQVVIRKNKYIIDTGTITAQSAGVISYSGTSTVNPTPNYGYVIQNSPALLTTLGEWSYDSATKRVYMYFGGADPNTYVVKASRYDVLANFVTKTNCVFSNLAFEGANVAAIKGGSGNNSNRFDNCEIKNSGGDGILFQHSNAITVTNSTFKDCNNQSLIILYTDNTVVTGNLSQDNCKLGFSDNGFGTTGWGNGSAMTIGTNDPTINFNNTVSNNRVINSGYNGIYVNGASFTCSNNYVDTCCTVKDDGGGIYSYTGATAYSYAQRTISNNEVVNSIGATAGSDGLFGNQGNGIYLDDNSSNITITGNTMAHCGNYGLFFHNAHAINYSGNTMFDCNNGQEAMIHDNVVPSAQVRTLAGTNNILVSRITSQPIIVFKSICSTNSTSGDLTLWGTANNNYYGALHNGTSLFSTQILGSSAVLRDLTSWKSVTAQDAASTFSNLAAYASTYFFVYNDTSVVKPVSLSGVYKDIANVSYSGILSIAAFQSYLLFQTSTALVPIISYSPSSKTCTQGQVITNMTPANTGGAATSYSISPSLPTGLSFNTTTGVVSGTPTVLSPSATYTVTATNTAGSGTTTINLTVNAVIPVISYPQISYAFTQQAAIANVIPSNSGGAVVSYSISPSLPAGLSFNTSIGVISGTPTVASANVSYAITGTNTGGSSTTNISIFIYPQLPNIAYSPATETYLVAAAITPISPTNIGGTIASYAITPALASGLSFNTTTGQISGTPTVITPATIHTVTATNANGTSATSITITVNSVAPNISYTPDTEIFIQAVPISPMSPANIGGGGTYTVTPDLPAGLSIDASTGVISGTPLNQSDAMACTVTATNVTGTSNATVTLSVTAKVPALYYSPSTNSYLINIAIAIWAPINTGGTPTSYAVTPSMPTGLTFDTATGAITGTPTVLQAATTYTITATNTGGDGGTTISITVVSTAPTIRKKKIHF